MQDFEYYIPTKVVFGKSTEEKVGELVTEFNGSNVLVVYGGKSAIKSGLIDKVASSLKNSALNFTLFGGVKPNPRLSHILEGIEICAEKKIDFILAVGGGSVIDTSKAIALGVYNKCNPWDLYENTVQVRGSLQVGCVLTIAATGSEMCDSANITNDLNGWKKRGLTSEYCRCKFAVENPELTMTLPAFQTSCGCTDIIIHTLERYFHNNDGSELTDALSASLIKTVMKCARILLNDPENYNARANVMWAGSLSHNGLLHMGNGTRGDWAAHQIEHELSGNYDVSHAAGLTAIWGTWARYVMDANIHRFYQFATDIMGVLPCTTEEETALSGINVFENFLQDINMPLSISSLGLNLSNEEIDMLAHKCTFEGKRKIGCLKVLDEEDIKKIYHMAL